MVQEKPSGAASMFAPKKKPVQEQTEDLDDDEESMDWWTKYFASVDAMIEVKEGNVTWSSYANVILRVRIKFFLVI